MVPYILLIIMPTIFYFVAIRKSNSRIGTLIIGKSNYIYNNNISIEIFFCLFFLILSLRGIYIGNDTANYKFYFEEYSKLSFWEIFNRKGDVIYILVNWLISRFTDNYQIFLSIMASLTLIPVYKQYACDRKYSFLKIILFMNMSVFVMFFSGLRQSLAIAVGVIAYEFVKNKKPIWFLLMSFIASGLHHSGFMTFLLYPIYYLRLRKKNLFLIIPVFIFTFVFNKQIFTFLTMLAYKVLGGKYDVGISATGAYTMIILFAMFAILSYVIPDESKMDKEAFGLRNYLLFAVLLQCFAPLHTLAMRMNYYFIVFIPIAIAKFLEYAKKGNKKDAIIIEKVLIVFFLSYYLVTTYSSCVSGISSLNIYPYKTFWKNEESMYYYRTL